MSRSFSLKINDDKDYDQNNYVPNDDLTSVRKGFSLKCPNLSFLKNKFKKDKKKTVEQDLDLAKNVKITQHLLTPEQLSQELKTDLKNGLTESEANLRLTRDGPNAFTPPKQIPNWLRYVKELTGGFALLLWFASLASFVSFALEKNEQDLYLGIVLAAVVIITATFSFYQQASSSKVFDSFKQMIPPQTYVMRDGKKKQISAQDIVVGDLVFCKGGDRVPADIRIISCEGMKVDNSSLTGESDALSRSPHAGHHAPLEAKNLAFFSTNCVDGNGCGVVIAIGDNTVMGNIAKLVSNIKNEKTPIAIEISRFVKIITAIAVTSGLIFFGIALGFGSTFFQAFIFMIGITVGNVPEGLLPALAVALTITAKQMASKNCLVKNLESVETLGSTTTICTDKTGTLTQNRMTVEHCYFGQNLYQIKHSRSDVDERFKGEAFEAWKAYSRCCMLCSRAEFVDPDDTTDIMKRKCNGDATETAILRYMESVGEQPVAEFRRQHTKVAEKPFSSTYKYQFSIHKNPFQSDVNFFLVMKGAPERILKMCSKYITGNGQTLNIDNDFIRDFEEIYRELGAKGERVIALCDREFTEFAANHQFDIEDENDFQMDSFRFLGLISMIDPPRLEVPEAVRKCRSAGIKVIMVTGDHPITAQAIAKQVAIFSVSHRRSTMISNPAIDRVVRGNTASIVVPGEELAEMDDGQLREILRDCQEIAFARTSPQQKLRIVENCQYLGQIVAVTGDGVNDSPALKKANIGIAMGITGSDVSKQAADMILLDDNFATIVIGVEEGRRIFDNMKKTVSYIMAGSVTTLYPFIIYVVFGFPLAIGTVTVLLICLGTDMLPAIALAYESAESDIMSLKPRNPRTDKLVTSQLLFRSYLQIGAIATSAGFFCYFLTFLYYGFEPQHLWQCRADWENPDNNQFIDSYGNPHTFKDRQHILLSAQSSYFIGIVVSQWIDVVISKTRRLSLFQHGMIKNKMLLFSLVFETVLAVLFCYTPKLNTVLSLKPVDGMVWLSAVPFFFYIFIYDELRKLIIRRYPSSFLGKQLIS